MDSSTKNKHTIDAILVFTRGTELPEVDHQEFAPTEGRKTCKSCRSPSKSFKHCAVSLLGIKVRIARSKHMQLAFNLS